MKRWVSSADRGQVENAAQSKQREAALQLQLAEKNLENLTLRQQAFTSTQQARPYIAQVLGIQGSYRGGCLYINPSIPVIEVS